ncbi:hypothetical protein BTO06_02195 [Tenacibaculum sp. SZ-18]|uniref:DUF1826 domain-containing protein n=1 Tax=Tenacibaculum sp. SZ-18 TaxID=754423 RepID=UPI000C2D62D4|nr:DUF1826 domain-containing protein [Tenacibaculum sp. SZ-18]AUC14040.1 hypothetical protein BTO06_02195 [Tenacibaculum sp. SZ-18]
MDTLQNITHSSIDTKSTVLKDIHEKEVNICVYNRNISFLKRDIQKLILSDIKINYKGDYDIISQHLNSNKTLNKTKLILEDITILLKSFKRISGSSNLSILLSTVKDNMCKRFHVDCNSIRMLCTYAGKGTQWLHNSNVNRKALHSFKDNNAIVVNNKNINQVATGAVILLKGQNYSKEYSQGIVHRSPPVGTNDNNRLLLRIDSI